MLSDTHYYMLVVSLLNYGDHVVTPDKVFDALTPRSLWLLSDRSPQRKRMARGDTVLFYLAGPRRRHVVADATITGPARPITDEEAAFARRIGLTDFAFALPLAHIRRWRRPVPIQPLYDNLTFIKDKRYPGLYLRRGVVSLSPHDSHVIRAAANL
jgi:hypothetical protein